MYHSEAIYKLIKDSDNVLDIGGAYEVFFRANSVIDVLSYDEMKTNTSYKGCQQHFTRETWHQQDICDTNKPWPFKDKEFDFAIAGHIMEDVKNPMYAISEMVRVSKKGFIEVPTRFLEQTIGLERPNLCGFSHHNWIIDTFENKIRCVAKLDEMSSNSKYHVQKRGPWPHLNKNYCCLGIFWEGDVDVIAELNENNIFDYYKNTTELVKNISELELFDVSATIPTTVSDPYKNDGQPHIHILFNHNLSSDII